MGNIKARTTEWVWDKGMNGMATSLQFKPLSNVVDEI